MLRTPWPFLCRSLCRALVLWAAAGVAWAADPPPSPFGAPVAAEAAEDGGSAPPAPEASPGESPEPPPPGTGAMGPALEAVPPAPEAMPPAAEGVPAAPVGAPGLGAAPVPAPLPLSPRAPAGAASLRGARAQATPGARKVAMNFKEAPLDSVVRFISELMSMNFILDDGLKGKTVTVISPTQITVEEAYEVFQSILVVKGFTIVPAGKVFKIVPTGEARQTHIETVEDGASPGDRFVTRIVPLKNVPVENVQGIFQQLVSKFGFCQAYAPTNSLIITDSFTNTERLVEIAQALDVETVDAVMEVIAIRYASAETLSKSLVQAVAEKARTQRKRPTPATPSTVPAQVDGSGPKIIADARTNSLIVIADPQTLDEIKAMIRALDVEIPKGTGKINVYYLKYADAENVAAVLTAISKSAGTKPKPGQPGQPAAPAAPAAATRVAGEISVEFEEPVQITADKTTNSLVVIATPQDFELLKSVIAKLDIRRPQVLVEALIMEMDYEKSLQLGVEWRTTNNPSSDGVSVIGGSNFGSLTSVMQNPLSVPMGLFLGAVDGTISFGGQEFLNVAALVTALQTDGDLNVLSTPHLLTTDNEEAEIVISDNIPYQTSQKFDNNGNPIFTFDYKDVGLTLRLTPQINEDNFVKLKLFQEISQLLPTSTGSTTPSTAKRSTKTTVIVKDGSTVVIGGLIKDNTLTNDSSVPCLGDIPLLGHLFKSSTNRKSKTNLLLFLTPHIIKTAEDMDSITKVKRDEYNENIAGTRGRPVSPSEGDAPPAEQAPQPGEARP